MTSNHRTIDELALRWAVHRQTVVRLIEAGRLHAFRVGRTWRITDEAVQQYEQHNEGPGTPIARLTYLLEELEKRFPGVVNPVLSDPPEPKLLKAIDDRVEELRECIRLLIFLPPNKSKSEVPGLEARLRKALGE